MNTARSQRWILIRDIGVFQFKLVCDGLRDLLLVPVSLLIGIFSLVKGGQNPGGDFYDLLRLGRRSEHWINLFGAAERYYGPLGSDEKFNTRDIDEMVAHVENFIVDEYRKGGVTAQAKERLDNAMDRLTEVTTGRKAADSQPDPQSEPEAEKE